MTQQAKKRKTRHDKTLSDHRHMLYHLENTPSQTRSSSDGKTLPKTVNIPRAIALDSNSYSYVTKDLRKTAFITIFIIFAQIILFFIINKI